MATLEILIVGLALSMDACAVTMANACAYPDSSFARRFVMPLVFGFFQGLMPVLGYLIGSVAASLIDRYAGPIAFVLLAFIGIRMIVGGSRALLTARRTGATCPAPSAPAAADGASVPGDAQNAAGAGAAPAARRLSGGALLVQGLATSVDALIVGVGFLALGANIAVAAPLIALTTFVCCLVALFLGRRFGALLGDKAEIIGGIVLVLIGIKALF
ncbi:MAG: manganese efflux pump MntP family protein [Coriobacteriales bacterium]|jgi:putative Mn2+ efflux pump MntP|nr:manganese efflux pump MntP family protein [Coriobacteriales bacterium]